MVAAVLQDRHDVQVEVNADAVIPCPVKYVRTRNGFATVASDPSTLTSFHFLIAHNETTVPIQTRTRNLRHVLLGGKSL